LGQIIPLQFGDLSSQISMLWDWDFPSPNPKLKNFRRLQSHWETNSIFLHANSNVGKYGNRERCRPRSSICSHLGKLSHSENFPHQFSAYIGHDSTKRIVRKLLGEIEDDVAGVGQEN
jgi:hypothetical protein